MSEKITINLAELEAKVEVLKKKYVSLKASKVKLVGTLKKLDADIDRTAAEHNILSDIIKEKTPKKEPPKKEETPK